MVGLLIFFIVVFLLAAGFAWLADQPGSLLLIKFGGFEFAQENLAVIAAILFGVALFIIFLWIVFATIWQTPGRFGSFFKNRRREKGWRAIAEAVIAVGAGDTAAAKKSAKNSTKYLGEEPVTKLLSAQVAQMEGNNEQAREQFSQMLEVPETELVGLRGLYMEAENSGEEEAARAFVERAVEARPGIEWSGNALMSLQAGQKDWEGALVTLQQNANAKLYTKKEAKRLRAVLLTAHAMQLESHAPQDAKAKAMEAHRLAPELVPAATTAARILSRLGDLRRAAKILETTWKADPHPEVIETYTRIRPGDSGQDRLKKAQALNAVRPNHPEGIMGLARIQIDLQDWAGARDTLKGLAGSQATERVCLLMSEIEEGEYGDRGRMREWLARAVRAPRDAVWIADGYVAERWAPVSPISGEIDAFEWRIPVDDPSRRQMDGLPEIPLGPPGLPVAGSEAITGASLVASDPDNLTYVRSRREDIGEVEDVEPEPEESVKVETLVEEEKAEISPPEEREKPATIDDQHRSTLNSDETAQEEVAEGQDGSSAPENGLKAVSTDKEEPSAKKEPEQALKSEADEAEPERESKPLATHKSDAKSQDEAEITDADKAGKDMEGDDTADDPIHRGPLDDPGVNKSSEPPRKKFRLFSV